MLLGEREERLEKITEQMLSMPEGTLIHFEMASFAEPELLQQLTDYVVPYADSLGMNEQVSIKLILTCNIYNSTD